MRITAFSYDKVNLIEIPKSEYRCLTGVAGNTAVVCTTDSVYRCGETVAI